MKFKQKQAARIYVERFHQLYRFKQHMVGLNAHHIHAHLVMALAQFLFIASWI